MALICIFLHSCIFAFDLSLIDSSAALFPFRHLRAEMMRRCQFFPFILFIRNRLTAALMLLSNYTGIDFPFHMHPKRPPSISKESLKRGTFEIARKTAPRLLPNCTGLASPEDIAQESHTVVPGFTSRASLTNPTPSFQFGSKRSC